MVKIYIKTFLVNDLNEEVECYTEGFYDKEKNIIFYSDNNVNVELKIEKDIINIKRLHYDYDLNIKFKKNKKHKTSYIVKLIKTKMDLETITEELIVNPGYIYIKYKMLLNNENMGYFKFEVYFKEKYMDIKEELKEKIEQALLKLDIKTKEVFIEMSKEVDYGDYSTNVAMQLAKKLKQSPYEIARKIIKEVKDDDFIIKKEIAGPGFINFWINKKYFLNIINEVIKKGDNYGCSDIGNNLKVNVEFVSANPTGVLHLGHARGAAYGDSLCRILEFAGYKVDREYYINDDGNQINNLGVSIYERYRGLCGLKENLPEDGYYGQEIIEIAQSIYNNYKDKCLNYNVDYFKEIGIQELLEKIKQNLKSFRIKFNIWTSERTIRETGRIEQALIKLQKLKKIYDKDGATWLKTTDYGDEKDRVLVKSDGEYAYIMPDIANHLDKFDRGNDLLIDVFGADHHGYISRLKSAVEALGYDNDKLEVKIIQMVRLFEENQEIKMSKRTGKVVTMNDLIEQVGVDVVRYFFAMRNIDTQMDFDVGLATKKSNENPVFYVQYAHARICSILKEVENIEMLENYETINSKQAYNILVKLHQFKEVVEKSALKRMPHLITNYVYELSELFHIYYTYEKIITNDKKKTKERILLIKAVKIIIKNALNLIGVEALEKM